MIAYESVSEVEHENVRGDEETAPEPPTSSKVGHWPVILYLYGIPLAVAFGFRVIGA